jgi:hypothetical protein
MVGSTAYTAGQPLRLKIPAAKFSYKYQDEIPIYTLA